MKHNGREAAAEPQLLVLQHFLKLQKWRFFLSWKTKERMDLWKSAAVGGKIIYLEFAKFSLGFGSFTLMSQSLFSS